MKAHTGRAAPAPRPAALPKAALLWGLDPADPGLAPLRAAQKLGIALRAVPPAALDRTVAELCGLPTGPKPPAVPAAPAPAGAAFLPALILCGLPEAERDALLEALRAAGATIPLKAIVTPTNQHWPFGRLLAELAAEHAALHGAVK